MHIRIAYNLVKQLCLLNNPNKSHMHITPVLTYIADAAKLMQHCKTARSNDLLES